MANKAKTIVITIIAIILFAVVMLFITNTESGEKPVQVTDDAQVNENIGNSTMKVPQCNDGVDNDNDNLIDYPEDLDCKDINDNFEKNYSFLTSFGYIAIGILVAGGAMFFYMKTRNSKEIDTQALLTPIYTDRAYELMISWFLKTKATSMPTLNFEEDDGFLLRKPQVASNIFESNRVEDNFSKTGTGEKFLYSFIEVYNAGRWNGNHLLMCSLQRGEDRIKNGDIRFERDTHIEGFTKKVRTFNPSSPSEQKDRMMIAQMDAIEEGDTLKAEYLMRQMQFNESNARRSNTQPSQYEDLDDNEFKQAVAQNMQNNNAQNKKKTKKNYNQSNYGIQPHYDEDIEN